MQRVRIAIVTNIPTPYRDGVYTLLSTKPDVELCVFYCSEREPNRHWSLSSKGYCSVILETRAIPVRGQYVHLGTNVWTKLTRWKPDVVFTSGYGPVMTQAFLWTLFRTRPHVAFTDGTPLTEASLTFMHRWVRGIVLARSAAFVGASRKSLEIFQSFGADEHRTFQSCLCIDNSIYAPASDQLKQYDVMFAGQLIPRKMPLFFAEVARELARRLGQCRVLLIGTGPLEQQVKQQLLNCPENIQLTMPGFIQPAQVPPYYRLSKLLLFPSLEDAWGVVANEAAAAGLPIITTPQTGVVGELVRHEINGFVLPPQTDLWANAAQRLLTNKLDYERMAKSSLDIVSSYTQDIAAKGIYDAALCAVTGHSSI